MPEPSLTLDRALDWLAAHGYDCSTVLDILPTADLVVSFVESEIAGSTK